MDYKQSGVDTEKARHLISDLKQGIEDTHKNLPTGRVIDGIGGFAGLFSQHKNFQGYDIVACTDGVGTKIELCRRFNQLDGLGQDLVAMCVNDLYCTGAAPAFFLDYIACGRLDEKWYQPLMKSIAAACKATQMALLGGETAEHPGVMKENDLDLAGFCVGFVDPDLRLPKLAEVAAGDRLVAIASSGLHSNGFSFVRKVLGNLKESEPARYDELVKNQQFISTLLKPTRLYTGVLGWVKNYKIKAISHITGGGIYENLPRVLPGNKHAILENFQPFSEGVFSFFKEFSTLRDLYETFSMGIGLVLVLSPQEAEKSCRTEEGAVIGRVEEGHEKQGVFLTGIGKG